jgi:TatD DNase family protein
LVDEAPEMLLRKAPGVSWWVVPGVDAASSQASLALAERFVGRVFAAVGLHPDFADQWPEQQSRIAGLVPRAIAVGETGLDFFRNRAPRHQQLIAFRGLLDLAVEFDKPVIVHCRDAFSEVHQAIEQTGTGERAIMHCWSGGPRWARRFLDLGVTFSFAGPVMIGTDDMIRRGAAFVDPDRAMVETDAPHLCPSGDRNRANDPADLGLVGAALALVWQTTCDEVSEATSATAWRVFRR